MVSRNVCWILKTAKGFVFCLYQDNVNQICTQIFC